MMAGTDKFHFSRVYFTEEFEESGKKQRVNHERFVFCIVSLLFIPEHHTPKSADYLLL